MSRRGEEDFITHKRVIAEPEAAPVACGQPVCKSELFWVSTLASLKRLAELVQIQAHTGAFPAPRHTVRQHLVSGGARA